MNRCILIGRTTKDIETKTSQSGMMVGRFTLAVDRKAKEKETDFISCIAFGKTAEVMEKFVKKGHRIGIQGHIQTGSYEKDGKKVYTTDVVVDELEFLEKSEQKTQSDDFASVPDDAQLPF